MYSIVAVEFLPPKVLLRYISKDDILFFYMSRCVLKSTWYTTTRQIQFTFHFWWKILRIGMLTRNNSWEASTIWSSWHQKKETSDNTLSFIVENEHVLIPDSFWLWEIKTKLIFSNYFRRPIKLMQSKCSIVSS